MSEIDPVQFGVLNQKVDTLEKQVTSLQKDMKELLELANKGKGGFWVGMTLASILGGVVSWFFSHLNLFKS